MANSLDAVVEWEASGDLERAIEECGRLVATGEAAAEALVRRAGLRRERGELTQAQEDLEQAARIDPASPWPLMRLGQLCGASGRNVTEAIHKQAAVDRAPDSFEMLVNAGAAYTQLDWLDLAYRMVRNLPEGLPDWWGGTRQLVFSRYRQQHRETRALLRTRRTTSDRILFAWEMTQRLFELGRLRVARTLCEGLMREMPDSFPAFRFYSKIVARDEGPAAAAAFLRSIAWLHRDNDEYRETLTRALHDVGLFTEVLRQSGASSVTDDPEVLRYVKAVAMLILGRGDDLRDYCSGWLRQSPGSVAPAGFVAATHYRESGLLTPPSPSGGAVDISAVNIIQFWDEHDVPADVAEVMESWSRLNPGVNHLRYDDVRARAFIAAYYGEAHTAAYDLCHHAAMKADYFRVAYLLERGGVWVDADELCLRPMDHVLVPAVESTLTAPLSGDTPGYLHNFFLGCRAGSPIMRFALDDATQGIRQAAQEGQRPGIWQATGPGLITRTAATYLAETPGEAAAKRVILLPLAQYRALARTEGSLEYKRGPAGNWQLV